MADRKGLSPCLIVALCIWAVLMLVALLGTMSQTSRESKKTGCTSDGIETGDCTLDAVGKAMADRVRAKQAQRQPK